MIDNFMRSKLLPLILLAVLLIYPFIIDRGAVQAERIEEKHILIFHPYASDYPAHSEFDKGVKETLAQNSLHRFSYSFEYLDSGRHSNDPDYIENIVRYLAGKYAYHQPDYIIVNFDMLYILDHYEQELFPNIPIIMSWTSEPLPSGSSYSNYIFIPQLIDADLNPQLILQTRPQTSKLYIIVGDSSAERQILDRLSYVERNYANLLEFVYLNKMSYPQMIETVGNAEEDSAILFIRWAHDVEGNSYIPEEVVREVAKEASAPVYTVIKHFLENGIVGGYVRDFEASGRVAANVVSELMAGNIATGQSIADEWSNIYAFDWRELLRWEIDERILPGDSQILFRETGIWQKYRMYISGGIVFMVLQSLLIIALLIHRKLRKRAEKELIEVNRMKDIFLINTSHELQTPLNGIINISESLIEGRYGSLKQQQEEELKVMLSVSRRLSSLINDIIDMEKIKRNEIHIDLAAISLISALSVALDVIKHLNHKSQVDIIVTISERLSPVRADENRLVQVLLNLLGNAIKYTQNGSIVVSAIENEENVKILIRDTGMGISEAEQKRLFQAFTQGIQATSSQYGGSGLGLYISRQLVERMSGRLELESSVLGIGSCFSITLPKSAVVPLQKIQRLSVVSEEVAATNDQAKQPLAEHFTLLAVDDEPTNLRVLESLLASDGYKVITVSNGKDAIRCIHNRRDIDLVLMDVMMPEMSGYVACRKIRERFSLYELPVLMLTVRNTPEDLAAGFEAGANDFVVKPFVAKELRARVATLLQVKKSAQVAVKNEMAFLQAQIKPHFLYNTLSTISYLCTRDGERAQELLSQFSSYLRSSIDFKNLDCYTTLHKELGFVETYLNIEKARFGDRLQVFFTIDEKLLAMRLPPLVLQPLVENAILHGIMKRIDGGSILISAIQSGDDVIYTVQDNGVGIPYQKIEELLQNTNSESVGLRNIHRRLKEMYGKGLQIVGVKGAGTTVTFRIPIEGGTVYASSNNY